MNNLTTLETEVMHMLLDGNDSTMQILRNQLKNCTVHREESGVGVYLKFQVFPDTQKIPGEKSFRLGDVQAEISGLKHGAGSLLFINKGFLDMLEMYSYDEPWPKKLRILKSLILMGTGTLQLFNKLTSR